MTELLLVDGPNLLMRAVMAMNRPGVALLSGDGVPTGPLVAFVNGLSRVVRDERPERVVICWDGPGDSWRTELDPVYKANRHRPDPQSEFEVARKGAFALAREFLTLAGIHHVERRSQEADDLIAAYWAKYRGCSKVIVSNDKDFLQLLDADTELVRLGSSSTPTDRWTRERFVAERGYTPDKESLVMALTGDVSDNVPGVPRIGPKTALKLLRSLSEDSGDWHLHRVVQHPRVASHGMRVVANYNLVNLLPPTWNHWSLVELPDLPLFRPTQAGHALYGALLAFLTRHRLASIEARLHEGELWRTREVST